MGIKKLLIWGTKAEAKLFPTVITEKLLALLKLTEV